MTKEFIGFLKQYGVIGLAIAVIIGGKFNTLLTAVVDGLVMPVIGLFTPSGNWREASWEVGPTKFMYGLVAGATIDFLIVAFIVFLIAKKLLKEETVAKR